MKITILGLGNPEEKYAWTRHNMGWLCMPEGDWTREGSRLTLAHGEMKWIKAMTGMNSSGEALWDKPQPLIVVVDDVDLPFGALRIKTGGEARHNGLKSIEQAMGESPWIRLKVGIGKNPAGKLLEYVLGEFTEEEKAQLPWIKERVWAIIGSIQRDGLEKTRSKKW